MMIVTSLKKLRNSRTKITGEEDKRLNELEQSLISRGFKSGRQRPRHPDEIRILKKFSRK